MKRILITCLVVAFLATGGAAQGLTRLLPGGPSKEEIASGIKEAIETGVSAGTERLSLKDGFYLNPSVKILFPPEAVKAESTLRGLGMNKLCDDFIKSMNQAAGEAVKEAKPIFVKAIKDMSVTDASGLLFSKEQDAATQYFKRETTVPLQEKFKPIIQLALERVGATKHWADIVGAYNKVPFVKKMNPDLVTYSTGKALDGLFFEVGKEELKIRQNAQAHTNPLLQKVFGFAEKGT